MDAEIRRLRAEAERLARGKPPSQVRYPDAVRRAAVALARRRLAPGGSVTRLAGELGVSEPTLTKWLRPVAPPVLRPGVVSTGPAPKILKMAEADTKSIDSAGRTLSSEQTLYRWRTPRGERGRPLRTLEHRPVASRAGPLVAALSRLRATTRGHEQGLSAGVSRRAEPGHSRKEVFSGKVLSPGHTGR
jgi:transposase-like protein